MATVVRGMVDPYVEEIKAALDAYEQQFPGARADIYRQNPASVRVRVIDERFAKMSRPERHDQVWDFLVRHVSGDGIAEVSVLLPLTRDELKESLANIDFDNPLPSNL